MKTSLLFACSFLLFSSFNIAVSQTIVLKGQITDKTCLEPLPGASVILHKQSDSSFVTGTITDSTGTFVLKPVSGIRYFLEISFLGFISDTIFNILPVKNKDFGRIELNPSKILLDEVSITSEKSILTYNLDKKVYHVNRDVMAESSSASEILQNIPSVSVDINGNITLRNTGSITFFLNGRPSALLRRNPAAVLEQIPASSIDRIEIITNPSAKYRPDGVGGIINIVLKKGIRTGLNGEVSLNAGNEKRYNTNLNLNYGTKNMKVYARYGLRHSNGSILYSDNRLYKDSLNGHVNSHYHEEGMSTIDALAHNVMAGMNYKINKNNNVELTGTYFHQHSLHNGTYEIQSHNAMENPIYLLTNKQTNNEMEKEGEVNLSYEHTFPNKEDHTLSMDATLSGYNEGEDQKFLQHFSFPEDSAISSSYHVKKSGNQNEINVDYSLPVGEDAVFESGYNGEFIFDNIRYAKTLTDRNQFLFNQQTHAFYLLYGQSINKFSFKTGLRAEQTYIRSHLISPTDTLVLNHYFKLFPTIHLGYNLSDTRQISLSYSKRINRPDADALNPNPEYSDPRNAEAGNPNLQPEQIHSLELSLNMEQDHLSLLSTLYYRYKYDAFTPVFHNIGDSLVLVTTTNLNTRQSGGLECALSGSLFNNRWNYNLTADVYYTTIDASNLGYTHNKSSISGNIKGYSLLKFSHHTFLQINAYYYFPAINPQGRRDAFCYLNTGIKQNLIKNRISLTLTVTDIFHTYKIKYKIESTELSQYTTIQRRLPVFYLGLIWRFNNYHSKDNLEYEGEGIKR